MPISEVRLTETDAADDAADDAARLRQALAAAPVWDKQVLEIGLGWPAVAPDQQWAADRLRVFLLTWDPFEWQADRPAAFATATSRADAVGLVLYLPRWQALDPASAARPVGDPSRDRDVALSTLLGRLGASVLSVASAHQAAIADGSYAQRVHSGALPPLLSQVSDDPPSLSWPDLHLVGDGWQPIQFDVLEDLAQDSFGPADLDRSPLRFSEPGEGRASCPGCAGEAVIFPDGLKDAQEAICSPHRAEALRVTTARLEAAKVSNPAGWEALLDAGQRLLEPHLPDGLGPRLVAAAQMEAPTTADLVDHAALVVGAAGLMAGLPDPQTGLGGRLEPVRAWLVRLPVDLAAHGLADQAAQVSEAAQELLAPPSAAEAAASLAAAAQEAAPPKPTPFRREVRVGRNAQCPCGSGKKFKFCHGTGR